MNIRKATIHDLNYFINTIHKIHDNDFTHYGNDVQLDDNHLNVVFNILLNGGGLCLIAEGDDYAGIAAGIINKNIWQPKVYMLHQIVLYVEEDWRHTKVGYNLIKEFKKQAMNLKDQNRILNHTIVAAEPLFDIDFERFGYQLSEKTWSMEI